MKLPKPRKRGLSYRIEIMLDGKRLSATRDTAQECTKWASQKVLEYQAQQVKDGKKQTMPFVDLLELYEQKVGKFKRSYTNEKYIKRQFISNFSAIAQKDVADITPKDLTAWRNARLAKVSNSTVRREIAYLSAVMSYAIKELFILTDNPFSNITKPTPNDPRERRITQAEIETILLDCDYQIGQTPTKTKHYVAWGFLFAMNTAMRVGEILQLKKSDIKDGYVHIKRTKNDTSRNVPLTAQAKQLLLCLDSSSDELVPVKHCTFEKEWHTMKNRTGIVDLHFHDTRHEAISRFVKELGLPVETLAKVTGHKDIRVLVNVYYNPTVDELVQLFQK